MIEKFSNLVFNIMVGVAGDTNPFELDEIEPIHIIRATRNPFSLNPIVILADPFLFVKDDSLFLFYEEQRGLKGKGIIMMTSTTDLKTWTSPICILKEDFHLSYPNIFTYKESVYLMPETGHKNEIRLYKMDEDLKSCKYIKTLIQGKDYVDSDVYCHNGIQYLFTSSYLGNKKYEAEIFVMENDFEDLKHHPNSPYSCNASNARCGGKLLKYNNKLFRIAQDCTGKYGGGLNAYEIIKLSPYEYKESYFSKILPTKKGILSEGGHQFNMVTFKGQNIIAIDFLSYNINIPEIFKRISKKII